MTSANNDCTPKLGLPYMMPGQVLKYLTQNQALHALDVRVQSCAKSKTTATMPTAPENGDTYIVPTESADWGEVAGTLVAWQDGSFIAYPSHAGWLVFIIDEGIYVFHDGTNWQELLSGDSGGQLPERLDRLGINADADDNNRLAVSSPATLLNHAGNDHRVSINKAAEGDTAALIFQENFSGRAEFGLTGSNDFTVKVSPDGQNFTEAFRISAAFGTTEFKKNLSVQGTILTQVFDLENMPTDGDKGAMAIVENDQGAMAPVFYDGVVWRFTHNLQSV